MLQGLLKCPFAKGDKRLDMGNQYQPFEEHGMREFFQMAMVEDMPVVYNEEIDYYIVTDRKEVMRILRDNKRYSAKIVLEPVTPVFSDLQEKLDNSRFKPLPSTVNLDPPDHPRIKQIIAPIFNRHGVEKVLPKIDEIVQNSVAALKGKKTVDIIEDFSYELPARVICHMLGVKESDIPKIKEWSDARLEFTFGKQDHKTQDMATDNLIAFWEFCEDLVDYKMENPADDYPSYILEKAKESKENAELLTRNRLVGLCFGLLLAGHETTTNMIANAIYTLLKHRDAWEEIRADHSLIPNAIEECLRLNGSVVNWRRRPLEDVEVAGTKIPAGANILVTLAGANLDENEFENPTKFDIHRKNAKRHITFGYGPHICSGAEIAREELRLVLEYLTTTYPNMALASDDPLDYIKTITFRGPKKLMVNLNESA